MGFRGGNLQEVAVGVAVLREMGEEGSKSDEVEGKRKEKEKDKK